MRATEHVFTEDREGREEEVGGSPFYLFESE